MNRLARPNYIAVLIKLTSRAPNLSTRKDTYGLSRYYYVAGPSAFAVIFLHRGVHRSDRAPRPRYVNENILFFYYRG